MHLVSPRYRNDREDDLSDEVREYLDKHYLPRLKNISASNPKLLVVFSGGNAVGKTTISRLIEQELGGVVLENDEIKRCILEFRPSIERDELNKLTWAYSMQLYKRIENITSNGLIVRDGVIDWYFDRVLPIFKAQKYSLFIIGFDISQDKSIELIRQRGDTPTVKEERFYLLIEDHAIHIKRFRDEYTPDIVLNDQTVFDHQLVIDKLRERIQELKSE